MLNPRIAKSAGRLFGVDSCSDTWRWRAMNFFDTTTFNNAVLMQELEKKKENQSVGLHKPQVMEEETNCGGMVQRPWDKLLPEILELIFRHCSLQEKLSVIPSVCKSWGRVVGSPYFWQHIDIMKWSTDDNVDEEARIRMLLTRNNSSDCFPLRTLSSPSYKLEFMDLKDSFYVNPVENKKRRFTFIKGRRRDVVFRLR